MPLIIDGTNLSYRFYFASGTLEDPVPMWISLLSRWKSLHPKITSPCNIVFDGEEKNREGKPDDYKAHRPPPPENLISGIQKSITIIKALGFPVHVTQNGEEADRDIARFSKHYSRNGDEVIILSSDKDLLQLVDDKTFVLRPSGKGEYRFYRASDVYDQYKIHPHQLPDYLTLAGDASDNIKGLYGCGPKTAAKLLDGNKTLLNLTEEPGKWQDKIRADLPALVEAYSVINLRRLSPAPFPSGSSPDQNLIANLSRVYLQLNQAAYGY